MSQQSSHEMLLQKVRVSSDLVGFGKEKLARFIKTVILFEMLCENFKRKLCTSL